MEKGDIVSEKTIDDFDLAARHCIYCKEPFRDLTVYKDPSHKKGCCWRYYLRCISCGMKNEIARLTDKHECTCEEE